MLQLIQSQQANLIFKTDFFFQGNEILSQKLPDTHLLPSSIYLVWSPQHPPPCCHDNLHHHLYNVLPWQWGHGCKSVKQLRDADADLPGWFEAVKQTKNSAFPIMQLSIVHHTTLNAWCMSATPSISCNRCTVIQTQAEMNADDVAMASCGWMQWNWRSVPLSSLSGVQDRSSPAPCSLQKVPSQPHIYIQMCKLRIVVVFKLWSYRDYIYGYLRKQKKGNVFMMCVILKTIFQSKQI